VASVEEEEEEETGAEEEAGAEVEAPVEELAETLEVLPQPAKTNKEANATTDNKCFFM